jgi:hypothetical protein
MIEIPTEVIAQFWQLIIAIVAAIVAYVKVREAQIIKAAYDVSSAESSDPKVIAELPERTWKMSDTTKRWLVFDATPENKGKILSQIEAAENEHKVSYQIVFDGGYYDIEYGLLKASSGNPSGK